MADSAGTPDERRWTKAETFAQSIRERGYPHSGAIELYGAEQVEAWRVDGQIVLVEASGVEVMPVPSAGSEDAREAIQRVVGRQPWQADWPECLWCSAPISPEIKTGHHHSPHDCLRELRKQRDALAAASFVVATRTEVADA